MILGKCKMAVSLFLEFLPGFWPQNFAVEKILGHKILLPRTSLAVEGKRPCDRESTQ